MNGFFDRVVPQVYAAICLFFGWVGAIAHVIPAIAATLASLAAAAYYFGGFLNLPNVKARRHRRRSRKRK